MNFHSLPLSILCLGTLLAFGGTAHAQPQRDFLRETPEERAQRMAWFNDARFGLFIHWGVYSVPAGEYIRTEGGQTRTNLNFGEWYLEESKMPLSQYVKFADQFNPVKFDAQAWVAAAKDAGMKYLVITSKHHDGFALWDSKVSDWDIMSTPFKRDLLKELAAACEEAGIRFCLYHSIMDWHHPDWGTRRAYNDLAPATPPNMDRYTAYMKSQLRELLTGYGPLGILWFDGEWESPWTHERGVDLYNFVRNLQPGIIINNRVGKGRQGMAGMDRGQGVGDYGTPEQEIPARGFGPGVYWESCMTMNNHWGYNKHDHNWKSTTVLIRNLVDCASKGGNYLLNVGPTAEGLIPAPSIERLAEIGAWMKVNGEAIYGTDASPFPRQLAWGRCTRQPLPNGDTRLYLFVYDWPQGSPLHLTGISNQPVAARVLATGAPVQFTAADGAITLGLPGVAPDRHASVVVLDVAGAPEVGLAPITQEADGRVRLPAVEADLHGGLQHETGHGKDNIGYWLNPEDTASWKFQVNQPGKFRVTAEIASLGSGKFELSAGGAGITGAAPNTGDYAKFQRVNLDGALELPAAGLVTLTVRPVRDGWQPINLKSLTLTPAR